MIVMNIPDLVDQLVEHSNGVAAASRGKAFETSVSKFTETLATVPDYPHAEMSQASFDLINGLAEQVIAHVERRIEESRDDESLKEQMAESVYAIRRVLEELFRWRRHFGRT